jgi:hypothetical protein
MSSYVHIMAKVPYRPDEEAKLLRLRRENPYQSWGETRRLFCHGYTADRHRTQEALKKKHSIMTKKSREQQPGEATSAKVVRRF